MNTEDLLELVKESGVNGNIPVKDFLGLQSEIPYMIYQINIGVYRLAIVYGGEGWSGFNSYDLFSTDDELKDHITEHIVEVFRTVIHKYRGHIYVLNVCDNHRYPAFDWKGEWARALIDKQLSIFMPIIQKFMVDALTDNLYVMEDGKPVKQ